MARFKYRMQNILGVKEKLETQAKTEFAIANGKVQEEQEKLNFLLERKRGYELEAEELLVAVPLKIQDITDNKAAILKMDDYIVEQNRQLELAQRQLEKQRIKLTQSMQERKTQEILKEYAFEEFLKEEKTSESKEIDELTSYLYGRKDDTK